MIISDIQLENFQNLYKSEFGKDISREDAYEKGMRLIRFFLAIHTRTPSSPQDMIPSALNLDTVHEALFETVQPS